MAWPICQYGFAMGQAQREARQTKILTYGVSSKIKLKSPWCIKSYMPPTNNNNRVILHIMEIFIMKNDHD